MAVWQYDISLVPHKAVVAAFGFVPSHVSSAEVDRALWRSFRECSYDFEARISKFLPRIRGFEWKSWGSDDGNRIDVFTSDNCVEDVAVRIDVRNVSREFVDEVVQIAAEADCLFYDSRGKLLQPTLGALLSGIEQSDAWRFVRDPRSLLHERSERSDETA